MTEQTQQILTRDEVHLLPVYTRYPIVMESGQGCVLTDIDGNEYLDLMGGLGVNALGHGHKRMMAALLEQAGQMIYVSPLYSNRWPGLLAEKLCLLSGMTGVFFSTGGSESVEGSMKLARTHARQKWGSAKVEIVALKGSYHGRTFGSLSVTGQDKYSADFGPGLPGVRFVERDDVVGLRAAVGANTCAILLEPVLGEGGVKGCSTEFLAEARRVATEHNAMLVFDEIQCGLGRTGDWFAFTRSGVTPDMLILGKPLGGGLPLSALLVNQELFHSFGLTKHGSTTGGSPLACRLGVEFLQVMEDERVLENVRFVGSVFEQRLASFADRFEAVRTVRGSGLMWALEMDENARPIAEEGLRRGMMFNVVQGNVLRFLPPLILSAAQANRALDVLDEILTERAALILELLVAGHTG